MVKENWFIVLELVDKNTNVADLNERIAHDVKKIQAKLAEKKDEWSRTAHGNQDSKIYLSKFVEIESDMLNSTTRDIIFKELKIVLAENTSDMCIKIGKYLKSVSLSTGNVRISVIENIAAKNGVDKELVKQIAAEKDIPIIDDEAPDTKISHNLYEIYYDDKPDNYDMFVGASKELKALHVENFYEFLSIDSPTKYKRGTPLKTLLDRSNDLKSMYKKKGYKNPISTFGGNLCSRCDRAFMDEKSKNTYDDYLDYLLRKKIMDVELQNGSLGVIPLYELNGGISTADAEMFINALAETFISNRKLSEEFLESFCIVKGIPYGNKPPPIILACRACREPNDVTDGTKRICSICGCNLYYLCPTCNIENKAPTKICQCGFNFEKIDTSNRLCDNADSYIKGADFDAGEKYLNDAELAWKNNDRIIDLRKRLSELKRTVGHNKFDELMKASKQRKYAEAKKVFEEISSKLPEFKETRQNLCNEISSALDEAANYIKMAKTKSGDDTIEFYNMAKEVCADFPGIPAPPAPMPPSDLNISSNSRKKFNNISWNPSSTPNVDYVIIRNTSKIPLTINDGDEICETRNCIYQDSNIESDIGYHYAVFAKRAEVVSKPVFKKGATINIFTLPKPQKGLEAIYYSLQTTISGRALIIEFDLKSGVRFVLPEIDVRCRKGSPPLSKTLGDSLKIVSQQEILKKKHQIKIPLPTDFRKNTYVKAFLISDDDKFSSPRIKEGSKHKIN